MDMESTKRTILDDKKFQEFEENGYLVFPKFLDDKTNRDLKKSVDDLEKLRIERKDRKPMVVELEGLGYFTSHPQTMDVLDQLFQKQNYVMHHIHAVRQGSNCSGVSWHHDYEQYPQTNRSHLMVHVFYYLNGLNGEVGDLLVLPGSQNTIAQRNFGTFGTEDLPGSITIDSLEPGSMIIVNSAVLHARRPKPGGENQERYFIDVSYCEKGILWPSYHNYKAINEMAIDRSYDRKGRYAHLYDSSNFLSQEVMQEKDRVLEGSLI